jgi:hypothetical protein
VECYLLERYTSKQYERGRPAAQVVADAKSVCQAREKAFYSEDWCAGLKKAHSLAICRSMAWAWTGKAPSPTGTGRVGTPRPVELRCGMSAPSYCDDIEHEPSLFIKLDAAARKIETVSIDG